MSDTPPRDTPPTLRAPPTSGTPIRLDHFLKRHFDLDTGGGAKVAIQGGAVQVNGVVETRRKCKLRVGDVVRFDGRDATVVDEPRP